MNPEKEAAPTGIDFYVTYNRYKAYEAPALTAKTVRRFDRQYWIPAGCSPEMSVLEIGCGTGLFLAYLREKGVTDFLGIDLDKALAAHLPAEVKENFIAADALKFLEGGAMGRTFDRVVMLDVLEHFSPEEGAAILKGIAGILNPKAKVLLRTPNMASPWGGQYQFGDLTHRCAFTPDSMRQLALASGFECRTCYAHEEGSASRRFRDRIVHSITAYFVMTPPEIWSANFFALLEPEPGA
jgi:2-polyprenyl-3-methyl-5-hydroxy-6-metoxy-1,4-benzoquinol methylase